jgi:hypothetical protein
MKASEFKLRRVTFRFADGETVTATVPCLVLPLDDVPKRDQDAVLRAAAQAILPEGKK